MKQQKLVYRRVPYSKLPREVKDEFLARFRSRNHRWIRGFDYYLWADPAISVVARFIRSGMDDWYVGLPKGMGYAA